MITGVAGPYTLRPDTTHVSVEVNAGEPINILVPILDDNDNPVEILEPDAANWSARAMVRRNALASTVLHEWTTSGAEPNAFIVPGDPAHVRLTALASETTAWEVDWVDWTCGFDLELSDPDPTSSPWRICAGPFRLNPQYTR